RHRLAPQTPFSYDVEFSWAKHLRELFLRCIWWCHCETCRRSGSDEQSVPVQYPKMARGPQDCASCSHGLPSPGCRSADRVSCKTAVSYPPDSFANMPSIVRLLLNRDLRYRLSRKIVH